MAGPAMSVGRHASSVGGEALRRVADTLGVPVAALLAPPEPHVLHRDPDGSCWLLVRDDRSMPIVRHVPERAGGRPATDANVSAFLAREPDSPQCRALAGLVDRALAAYLAR